MEAKPLRSVPSSPNTSGERSGPQKKIDMGHRMEGGGVVDEEGKRVVLVKEENASSCVELDLGVGAPTAPLPEAEAINHVITARHHKCCLFTEAQRRELDHQVFIFNHFACNLPLPHHLVLPIFDSAAATLDSGFHKQFPSYMSEYCGQGFDYGSMVDPEPHRCRRTDGKKWRCSRNAVPDQKYCERHMHRGCNRSRKPVETCQVNSPLTTKPSGKLHNKLALSNTESAVSNPNPLGAQPIDTSSCTLSRSHCVLNTFSTNNRLKNNGGSADYHTSFSSVTVVSPGSTLTSFSDITSVVSDNRSSPNICKKDDQTKSCISKNISFKSGGKGRISISTGIGFSPRSVLQVSGCNSSYLSDKNSIELEPGRCRRTDGKKWRCKSAVLPGQKYCATHMHRGAKRRFADHEPATSSSVVTIAQLPYSTATTNIQKACSTIPNTKLSMSIPASAPLTQYSEKSPISSDTDTTITDTMNEYSYASF